MLTTKDHLEYENLWKCLDDQSYQNILGPWNSRNDLEILIQAQM